MLGSLLEWIQKHNQHETSKIDNSVLMIDDEADFASVNTKAADEDPSRTNKLIEQLLNIFRFSSYVGFTATPYANVFIDPETDEDMEHEVIFLGTISMHLMLRQTILVQEIYFQRAQNIITSYVI